MTNTPYTVGLIQMACVKDAAQNLAKAEKMLREAAKKGVQVACLPELFMGEYFCQTQDPAVFDLAEPVPGPTTTALAKVAKETGMVVIGSIFEKRAAGVYHNTNVVLDAEGKLVGIYRKMHIPDDPLFLEKYYFTPGDTGFRAFDTKHGRIGTLICWDQWFPEAARLTAMQGAEVIFYPTAIGWHPSEKAEWEHTQVEQWVTVQRGHAISNGVYVAAVNRVGHEIITGDGIEFFGNSFVADPYGRIVAQASQDKEEILIAKIDPALVEQKRRHWPFLRDRRIDAYTGITERFSA